MDWGQVEEEEVPDQTQQQKEEALAEERRKQQGLRKRRQLKRELLLSYEEDEDEDEDGNRGQAGPAHPHSFSIDDLRREWQRFPKGYLDRTKVPIISDAQHKADQAAWNDLILHGDKAKVALSELLKERGIVDTYRNFIWPIFCGSEGLIRNPTDAANFYTAALTRSFGQSPSHHSQSTTAGASTSPSSSYTSSSSSFFFSSPPSSPSSSLSASLSSLPAFSVLSTSLMSTSPPTATAASPLTPQAIGSVRVPKRFGRVPTFGGKLVSHNHCVNAEGTAAAKRLLTALAIDNPEFDFIPPMPDIVLLLLHYLSEPEVYVVVTGLLHSSKPAPHSLTLLHRLQAERRHRTGHSSHNNNKAANTNPILSTEPTNTEKEKGKEK
jgi:hypothetical protein